MDVTTLRAALAAEPMILTAWLFGSQARGTARADSDVDVAVQLGDVPDRAEAGWDLEARLTAATGLPIQVVVIDSSPADLVHRVLRDGRLLLERDRPARVALEVRKRNEYFDMTPIWRSVRRLPAGVDP
jgi:predicted nucleotidyltransferase